MGEVARCHIRLLLRRGDTAIERVAMGVASKPFDHAPHPRILGTQPVPKMGQAVGHVSQQIFGQRIYHIEPGEVVRPFAMADGDAEKQPLPRAQLRHMPVRDPLQTEARRLDVLPKGSRRVAPQRPGELVQHDQQGQSAARGGGPVVQLSARGGDCKVCKTGADRLIHPAIHPRLDEVAKAVLALPEPGVRKPEIEHLLHAGCLIHGAAPLTPSLDRPGKADGPQPHKRRPPADPCPFPTQAPEISSERTGLLACPA